MRKFETLLLLSPELPPDAREAILIKLVNIIEKTKGQFTINHWGMRDLAYPVQKHMSGYYVLLEYTTDPNVIEELERIIRITNGIFKFMTIKLEDHIERKQVEEVA